MGNEEQGLFVWIAILFFKNASIGVLICKRRKWIRPLL